MRSVGRENAASLPDSDHSVGIQDPDFITIIGICVTSCWRSGLASGFCVDADDLATVVDSHGPGLLGSWDVDRGEDAPLVPQKTTGWSSDIEEAADQSDDAPKLGVTLRTTVGELEASGAAGRYDPARSAGRRSALRDRAS